MTVKTSVNEHSASPPCYPQVSWDEHAESGETCCKETADRHWYDDGTPVPMCGRRAFKVIVSENGERLPFCGYHWVRG